MADQQFVQIKFAIQGEQQISRAFLALEHEVADLSTPLDRMADVILDSVREQFDTEGRSGLGFPWSPLSPAYAAWKRAHYGPRPILVRTGGMKGELLNKQQTVSIVGNVMTYEPHGGRAEVAAYHQDGSGHLPQRKIVALTTAQKTLAVDRVFSEWLLEVRTKVGLTD